MPPMPGPGPGPGHRLTRNVLFSGSIGSAIAALLYGWLPQSLRLVVPIHEFILVLGMTAGALQRAVIALWNSLIGHIAREAKEALFVWVRAKRIALHVRQGAITPERGDELLNELVEASLKKGIGSGDNAQTGE
jgi:hypothetical protein